MGCDKWKNTSVVSVSVIIGSLFLTAVPLTVSSEDTSFYIEGYVYHNNNSSPISDLAVTLFSVNTEESIDTETDQYGYYMLDAADLSSGYEKNDVIAVYPADYQGSVAYAKPIVIWTDPDGQEAGIVYYDFYLSVQEPIQVFDGSLTGVSVDHGQQAIDHDFYPAAYTEWSLHDPPMTITFLNADATDDFSSTWSVSDFYTLEHAYAPYLGYYTLYVDVAFYFAAENELGSDSDIDTHYYTLDPGDEYSTDPALIITMSHASGDGSWTTFTYDIWGTWGYLNLQNQPVEMGTISYDEKTWSGWLRSPP